MQSHSELFVYLFEFRRNFVNMAYSYVHDHDVANDIVNDVFTHLWAHRDEIDWDVNLKGYVYIGIRTRCISWLRKLHSSARSHDEMGKFQNWRIESGIAYLEDGSAMDKIFSGEVLAIYRRELARMPRLTREVFLASREHGRTYQEIADRYGIKVRKVTAEIQRALGMLRRALKDYL